MLGRRPPARVATEEWLSTSAPDIPARQLFVGAAVLYMVGLAAKLTSAP